MTLAGYGFGQPWWLVLLVVVLPVLAWFFGGPGRPNALRYSSTALLADVGRASRLGPRHALWLLRLAVVAAVILAMAQPRREKGSEPTRRRGIDVVLCCDVSPSMDWADFTMNGKQVRRLDAVQAAVVQFLDARPNDRTGMVVFSTGASIVSPLTLGNTWLADILTQVETGGTTAIGEGIYASVDLLKESKEKSKVIILITDGGNMAGRPPADAANYARQHGVKLHAVAIADFATMVDTANSDIHNLSRCAQITGGQLFKATDPQALVRVYHDIDRLEKHRIEQQTTRLYTELFPWFAGAAVALGMIEVLLGSSVLLRVP